MGDTSSAAGISPFASWRCEHTAIRVPDLEAARKWYSEKLDFQWIKSVPLGNKVYGFMAAPAVEPHFVLELVAGPGAEDRPAYQDLSSSLRLSGLHHIGFHVRDVPGAIAELKNRGVSIVVEPRDVPALGLKVAFFADPWGNLFEVVQPLG
ncbi:VOC family protein [Silvibacterium acidisoli]|uniref:VOC family protein n=1 Tax=Acidobacteriaceae bacterium ZG23-2 TaxID=2883246 RepID=UPI00406CC95E